MTSYVTCMMGTQGILPFDGIIDQYFIYTFVFFVEGYVLCLVGWLRFFVIIFLRSSSGTTPKDGPLLLCSYLSFTPRGRHQTISSISCCGTVNVSLGGSRKHDGFSKVVLGMVMFLLL